MRYYSFFVKRLILKQISDLNYPEIDDNLLADFYEHLNAIQLLLHKMMFINEYIEPMEAITEGWLEIAKEVSFLIFRELVNIFLSTQKRRWKL